METDVLRPAFACRKPSAVNHSGRANRRGLKNLNLVISMLSMNFLMQRMTKYGSIQPLGEHVLRESDRGAAIVLV